MKPTPNSAGLEPLLAFGAHPDDIEFACGGVVARETSLGRSAHFVVCSRGESASHGTPEQRAAEAEKSAQILGASLEFVDLDGDARLGPGVAHAIALAGIIRRIRPALVLAPSLVANQHPDHAALGKIVCDAARLARYGGVAELRSAPPHAIGQLFYYAVSPSAEPRDISPIFVDVSSSIETWTAAMEAHASQTSARNYVDLQLVRARANGLRAGVSHAIALFPADPTIVDSLASVARGARAL
jgi:LmbE family N-acetylglucosaminyl deacetylase